MEYNPELIKHKEQYCHNWPSVISTSLPQLIDEYFEAMWGIANIDVTHAQQIRPGNWNLAA